MSPEGSAAPQRAASRRTDMPTRSVGPATGASVPSVGMKSDTPPSPQPGTVDGHTVASVASCREGGIPVLPAS